MSSLIVWLGQTHGASARYPYVTSKDGTTAHKVGQAQASLLPGANRGAEVIAIVPATSMSWHEVRLPKGISVGSPRLRQVLEGLLEDKLLTEVADTHLALAPSTTGDTSWVAACDRGWLRNHLQTLEAANRTVNRIVPELAPGGEHLGVHITGEAQLPWLLANGASLRGVLCVPLSPGALQLLPPLGAVDHLDVTAEPAVVESAESVLQVPLRLQTRADCFMEAAQTDWDLAQMEFASTGWAHASKRAGSVWRNLLYGASWRPARWGVLLVLLANLIGVNALAWKEQRAHEQRKQAMNAMLTKTFPSVRVVVDAPVQMGREVEKLRQATGALSAGDMDAMLSAVAPHLGSQTPSEIDYTVPAQLVLKGVSLGPDELNNLNQALATQRLAAQMNNGDLTVSPSGDAR